MLSLRSSKSARCLAAAVNFPSLPAAETLISEKEARDAASLNPWFLKANLCRPIEMFEDKLSMRSLANDLCVFKYSDYLLPSS